MGPKVLLGGATRFFFNVLGGASQIAQAKMEPWGLLRQPLGRPVEGKPANRLVGPRRIDPETCVYPLTCQDLDCLSNLALIGLSCRLVIPRESACYRSEPLPGRGHKSSRNILNVQFYAWSPNGPEWARACARSPFDSCKAN